MVIVSLTTFPARIRICAIAIESLLSQIYRADKIILNLKEPEFPRRELDLPPEIIALKSRGLEIGWWPRNIRSYAKLIPTLAQYPDATIVTADDDLIYAPDWLEKLMSESKDHPRSVVAGRAHLIAMDDGRVAPYANWLQGVRGAPRCQNLMPTGCGGIVYPPHSLDRRVLDENLFGRLCPYADDLWFWAMRVLNGTPARVLASVFRQETVADSQENSLSNRNVDHGGNDSQMTALLAEFPALGKALMTRFKPNGEGRFGIFTWQRRNRLFRIDCFGMPLFVTVYNQEYTWRVFLIGIIPVWICLYRR